MRDETAMSIFPSSPEAFWTKNRSDESDASALCGDKVRGTRILFPERGSNLRLNDSFSRKMEPTNKIDKISIGFRRLVDFRSEMKVGGSEANKAMWNIFMLSTATCWQGYIILVGFLPVLIMSQIALTTARKPSPHRLLLRVLCFFIEWGQPFLFVISINLQSFYNWGKTYNFFFFSN